MHTSNTCPHPSREHCKLEAGASCDSAAHLIYLLRDHEPIWLATYVEFLLHEGQACQGASQGPACILSGQV